MPTYNKQEKLKSRKLIKQLFEKGKAISVYPLRLVYLKVNHEGAFLLQTGVSVSKRNFKLAVDRNRIKRLMREVYRLNKTIIYSTLNDSYIIMFIYLGNKEIDYVVLDSKMQKIMHLFLKKEIKKSLSNKT